MRWIGSLFFLCITFSSFSQDSLSGKVMSDKGEPLPGASVFISDTKIGTTTGANGEFVLSHLPAGNAKLVIAFVGYETETVEIHPDALAKRYLIRLQPQSHQLKAVVIAKYDKRGWKKWGSLFTDAFIGTSSFAKECMITNKDVIHFMYNDKTKQLYAFADEPLKIENKSLGYHIAATLSDFHCETETGIVDYLVNTLFEEMDGTEEEKAQWSRNREQVYSYSLLRFMRAVHNQNFKNEGYQVRLIESTPNAEKQRVQQVYKERYDLLRDSLQGASPDETVILSRLEKSFTKDSLLYYRKILAEEDRTSSINFNLVPFKNIARLTDSNTVVLSFNQYLQVTYSKAKEPQEYVVYKNKLYLAKGLLSKADIKEQTRLYPSTELSLPLGIPIQIFENGHFENVDLFMNGFWGWWEKMAAALPYDYEP